MTHEELKERIMNMDLGKLENMSPHNVAKLTDDFCEELIKFILIQSGSNPSQHNVMNILMLKYGEWRTEIGDILWDSPLFPRKYPEYMANLQFDIECGKTITDEGCEEHKLDDKIIEEPLPTNERISVLENENHRLRSKIEELSHSINEQLDVKLEKENDDILYNKVSFEFFLRLLEYAGFDIDNTGNKTRVGKLWHMITGKSADDLRKFCSDRRQYDNNHTKEDIKLLNKHLSDMGISEIEL
jgi:hypothetical protein